MNTKTVSIIIPAFNEEAVIGRLLQSINNQDYKNCEAIVVDDASKDKTVEIAKKYTKHVYRRSHAERSIQRNFGAKKSTGKYLFFLDADMELDKDVVSTCVKIMEENKKIGSIAIPEKSIATNFWERVKAFERSFYSKEGDNATDAPRFFSREAFLQAGGYDETITGPEDWDLPESIEKLGYKRKWVPVFINHYERVPSLFSLARKKFYYGLRAHRYFSKQKVSLFSPKTIYFLRPVFYKNWKVLAQHPILTFFMFVMLTAEQIGGGLGFLIGKYKNL